MKPQAHQAEQLVAKSAFLRVLIAHASAAIAALPDRIFATQVTQSVLNVRDLDDFAIVRHTSIMLDIQSSVSFASNAVVLGVEFGH